MRRRQQATSAWGSRAGLAPSPSHLCHRGRKIQMELPWAKGLRNRGQFASSSQLQEYSYIAGEEQEARH